MQGQIEEDAFALGLEATATSQKSTSPDEVIVNHEEELETLQDAMDIEADASAEPASADLPQRCSAEPAEGAQARPQAFDSRSTPVEVEKLEGLQNEFEVFSVTLQMACYLHLSFSFHVFSFHLYIWRA